MHQYCLKKSKLFLQKILKKITKEKEGFLGFRKKNKEIYTRALNHSSLRLEKNNERLEFLGDAVLNMIISGYLYKKLKKDREGDLSKKRAIYISRKQLNNLGEKIIGKTNLKHKAERITPNMFGNALEAIIGAIYIDKGYDFVKKYVEEKIIKNIDIKEQIDYKSILIQWAKKRQKEIVFQKINKTGPDHKKKYLVQVIIEQRIKEDAWGKSVKEGEQKAAKKIYQRIKEK